MKQVHVKTGRTAINWQRFCSYFLILTAGICFCLLDFQPAVAQSSHPEFDAEVVTVREERGADHSRLDLYTKIPLSNLLFITSPGGFSARYEVVAEVYEVDDRDRVRDLVSNRVWNGEVLVPTFAATQVDSAFDYTTQSLLMAPGRYMVRLRMEDQNSNRLHALEIPVEVKDFRNKSVAVSDVLVLDTYDERQQTITPSVSNTIEIDQPSFTLFYEIYARQRRPVRIVYEIHRASVSGPRHIVRSLFGLRRDGREPQMAETAFSNVNTMPLRIGRNPTTITVPLGQFKVGDYLVRVIVQDEQGNELDATEKLLAVRWIGVEEHIFRNLDDAIAQLKYIAKDRELNFIGEGETRAEREARFRDFWRKRDPTPGSDRNERMEEYYHRVAYVNENFGRQRDGWLTDRGEVFIRFGAPDNIERQSASRSGGMPTEVWHYGNIGRRFIFVEKGAGNYELMVPIWDERTRM